MGRVRRARGPERSRPAQARAVNLRGAVTGGAPGGRHPVRAGPAGARDSPKGDGRQGSAPPCGCPHRGRLHAPPSPACDPTQDLPVVCLGPGKALWDVLGTSWGFGPRGEVSESLEGSFEEKDVVHLQNQWPWTSTGRSGVAAGVTQVGGPPSSPPGAEGLGGHCLVCATLLTASRSHWRSGAWGAGRRPVLPARPGRGLRMSEGPRASPAHWRGARGPRSPHSGRCCARTGRQPGTAQPSLPSYLLLFIYLMF